MMFDIYKVGAGIGGDASKVSRDYFISIKGVEDLSYHANQKLGGGPNKWGLASLTEKLLSKQVRFEFIFLKNRLDCVHGILTNPKFFKHLMAQRNFFMPFQNWLVNMKTVGTSMSQTCSPFLCYIW